MCEKIIIELKEKNNNNNSEIIKRYQKGKLLGEGSYSKTYEFIDQENNHLFIAKIISKNRLQT